MTCLELFAGCGGLYKGFEKAGIKNIGLVDNDKSCCLTLRENGAENVYEMDIKQFYKNLPDIHPDIISLGLPCQVYSVIGKRMGLKDERGKVFFTSRKIIKLYKPKIFVIENVEGLKSHNGGETLKYILHKMEKLGYVIYHKILNAMYYEVPQKRKRIFIIGIRSDIHMHEYEFPDIVNDKPITLINVLKDVPKSRGVKYSKKQRKILKMVPQGGCWINLPKYIQKQYMGKSYYSGGGKRGVARRLSWDEPCLTLTTSPNQKQTCRCHPDHTRPLTIREYARIQTFDDTYTFMGSITSQYKQIGNAVPIMLAYHIGKSLVGYLNKTNYTISYIDRKTLDKLIDEVYEKYSNKNIQTILDDKFKKLFDMHFYNLNENEWNNHELMRIHDKAVNNYIGYFHQKLLGSIKGYINTDNYPKLKKKYGVDLINKEKNIYIELKNKFNTMNSSSKRDCIQKLKKITENDSNAKCYIGIVNDNRDRYEQLEKNIYIISGNKLYDMITGEKNSMENILKYIENKK